jgi:hypothetical protein
MKECIICGFNKRVHLHHIIKRAEGGSEDNNNLVYLCPNHHWIADFGEEDDRIEILRLIKEISNKTGCKISNEEDKILDLKIRLLQEHVWKESVWDDEWWLDFKETSNYATNKAWLLGRRCPREVSIEMNEKSEKLMLIKKIRDTMKYEYA